VKTGDQQEDLKVGSEEEADTLGVGDKSSDMRDLGFGRRRADFLAQPSRRVIAETVLLLDFFSISVSSILAQWIYIVTYLGSIQNIGMYLTVGVLGAIAGVTAIRSQGVYEADALSSLRNQSTRLLFGLAVAFVALLTAGYFLKVSANFSRGWMFTWLSLSFSMLIFIHFVAARILKRWKSFGLFARRVAVYGSGDVARSLIERLSSDLQRVRILGVFDDLSPKQMPSVLLAGGLSDLIRMGQETHFDEVIIALPSSEPKRIENAISQLSILPTKINLCPDGFAFNLRPLGVVNIDGVSLLELVQPPMDNWAPILKAIEDRVLAGIAIFLVLPFLLLIALAIKIDSAGPVFFKQRRHGFNHRIISVFKFRTMNVTLDGAHIPQTTRHDPRVTRVGRFLRRTSLDELPQLFNVLRGDMSLVGPRPHAVAHNEHYASILEIYAVRHKVKPGITGWAQINGYRGETDTPEKMRKRVEYDLYYIENWSIWFDVKILFLTPFLGLFGKNAF
tara:strand:+ start:119971 stop:121488 length:1518 start_codon:yes stop_codon:yes gene_type:complete